ncbi:hypothetical protein [Oceanospirillum sediminis]|uniref:Uracil-DNA glycosylase-like domain-containing protein n=1 Tax=Oceanospirillum sediminis TaxID=2760088 RepID=A0A839IXT7_9GAMM|nr:hypothetical protein [Oceanospirillum sediminis]MBB1489490.1 hypothetical protein [Oceanospirillum sediminis]
MKKVRDILPDIDQIKVVLVLESPYKDELIHGHPLAGKSGMDVSSYLNEKIGLGFASPLGCEIKSGNAPLFGVMNASLMPLDKRCYSCSDRRIEMIDNYDFIRRNPKTLPVRRRNRDVALIERELISSFKKRFDSIRRRDLNITYVPCGELADKFLGLINDVQKIDMLPHPSFNQWKGKDFVRLNELIRSVI